MASYKERILEVIGESEVGLTTVDVAKKARVSKTTVIKYLSMLSSEGRSSSWRWDLQSSGGRETRARGMGKGRKGR